MLLIGSEKCDSLLEQKRELLERISSQKRQIDLMLEMGEASARVRTLLQVGRRLVLSVQKGSVTLRHFSHCFRTHHAIEQIDKKF